MLDAYDAPEKEERLRFCPLETLAGDWEAVAWQQMYLVNVWYLYSLYQWQIEK